MRFMSMVKFNEAKLAPPPALCNTRPPQGGRAPPGEVARAGQQEGFMPALALFI